MNPCSLNGEWLEPEFCTVYGYGCWVQCFSKDGDRVVTRFCGSSDEAIALWNAMNASEDPAS